MSALIEKLEALFSTTKGIERQKGIIDAMTLVRRYESDIIIENDRVCINGKWYFAMPVSHAVTSTPPQKTAQ